MLIVLTCRSASAPPSILSRASVVRRLDPLGTSDAGALLRLAIGSELELHPGLVERCVALGAGNALFLRTIGEHFRRKGAEPSSEATLHDLLLQRCNSLSPTALLVLRSVVALGIHGTQDRLDRCLALSHGALLLALQELCDRGLVVHSEDGIQCAHDLLADLVTSETPKALLVGICSRVAAVLEEDGALSRQPALLWACAECWTLASSRSRAAAALRKCAGVAMNVGQPRFAIEALEKAQGYVSDEELGSCIEDTIRIADDAWDPQAVFRNLERIRTWRRSQGRDPLGSTIAEIAALNGARRAEVPIWEHRELMHRCVNNPEASVLDRLRAARVFHLVAEEHLDREAADSLHASVTEGLSIDPTSSAGLHYLVTYHGTFGTLTEGAAIAHDLVARHTTGDQPPISAVTYSAVVLFRHGHVDEACRLCKRFLALAQKAKLAHHTIALYAAQLAAMLIQEGDQDQAEHFNSLALENIASSGRSHNGATLSNLIDLAIARGRFEQAGEMQAQLRSEYSTMFTPNRERVALGNDLLIAVKRGRLPMTDQVTAAEQLFAIGATLSDADALALGLMATYHAQGDRFRARAFGSHYLESLRRDNYRLTPVFRDCFGSLQ